MTLRLSRGEYWLLEAVLEHYLPVYVLGLPEGPPWTGNTIEMSLNKRGHGLDRSALIRTLLRLQRLGWIELQLRNLTHGDLTTLVMNEVELAFEMYVGPKNESDIYYRLTSKGGAIWEAFARPDWTFFLQESVDWDDDGNIKEWTIRGNSEKHVLSYFSTLRESYDVTDGSVRHKTLIKWQGTYWKNFPSGFELAFDAIERTPRGQNLHKICAVRDSWYQWR
jgi:hypothetical protein